MYSIRCCAINNVFNFLFLFLSTQMLLSKSDLHYSVIGPESQNNHGECTTNDFVCPYSRLSITISNANPLLWPTTSIYRPGKDDLKKLNCSSQELNQDKYS